VVRASAAPRTQPAISSAPKASSASVFGEPQPQVLVWVIASSTPEMPAVISAVAR